jgi:hypothetical protein
LDAAPIHPRTAGRAEGYLEDLQEELSKTGADETPDARTIIKAGDWLLNNTPELASALGGLFTMPAVGRLLGRGGEGASQWVRSRFGRAPTGPA